MAVTLVAHRDPQTLEWSDEPLQPLPEVTVISDPPPWWRWEEKRDVLQRHGARRPSRNLMLASALCTDTVEEAKKSIATFTIFKPILSLSKPQNTRFPSIKSWRKRANGSLRNRAFCHGTYGDDSDDALSKLGWGRSNWHRPRSGHCWNRTRAAYGRVVQPLVLWPNYVNGSRRSVSGVHGAAVGWHLGHRTLLSQWFGSRYRRCAKQCRTPHILKRVV